MRMDTQKLALTSLMTALILAATIAIRIPIPLTQGYIHLGDAMVYFGVIVLGRRNGSIAAGLGSSLADVLGGFAVWAPWSLVIKSGMAFIAGSIMLRSEADHRFDIPGKIIGMAAGGLFMTAGYFAAETVMYGNPAVALIGIPWNVAQFAAGTAISLMLSATVKGKVIW